MGSLSETVRNAMLDALGNAAAYSEPGVYVKLHTGDPGAAGTNNAAANTTRVQASFSAAAAGALTNDALLEWTSVPNAETYTHVSLWDANAAGTFLGSDDLSSPAAVAVGDTFRIPVGDLDIALT